MLTSKRSVDRELKDGEPVGLGSAPVLGAKGVWSVSGKQFTMLRYYSAVSYVGDLRTGPNVEILLITLLNCFSI